MTFADLINVIISSVVNPLIILVSSLALLYFLWGVSKYILHSGNEEKRGEGYQMMIYGVIALFVMVSVWGLVGVLSNTFLGGATGGNAGNSYNIGAGVNVTF